MHRLERKEIVKRRTGNADPYWNTNIGDETVKIIVIGDPAVGKTSFVQRYVKNEYCREYKGTLGVDFALKIEEYSETHSVKVQMWDIAGQERFTWMTRVYYKDAHGCVIMFDVTNMNSFVNVVKWKNDVDSKCLLENGEPIPCLLLANKCDLRQGRIDLRNLDEFHKLHNFVGYSEVSARKGTMVEKSMKFLVEVSMINAPPVFESSENCRLEKDTVQKKSFCSCYE